MKSRFVIGGAAAFWAALCLVSMLATTGGKLSMPLDDAFIFFQYARRVVEGAPFTYQPGDPVTAGATSLLTVFVDAVGYLVGFRAEAMVVFAILAGAVLFAWAGWSALALGKRLVPEAPWLAPALVLTSGPLIWGFASGMDLPLFVALALAWAARWPEPGGRPGRAFFAIGAVLGLARPDAVFLVVPALALAFFGTRSPAHVGTADPATEEHVMRGISHRFEGVWWLLPIGGVALPFVLQLALTGHPGSASLEVKSILSRPDLTFGQWLVEGISYLAFAVKGVLGGGSVESAAKVAANDASGAVLYVIPFALGLAAIGLVPGAWIELRGRRPGLATLLLTWTVFLLLAQAFTVPRNWHWNRYLMPVYALVLPGAAAGLGRLGRLLAPAWPELKPGDGARALGIFAILLGLPSAAYFVVAYGRNCADIRFQHIDLARRLNALPQVDRNTVVGVHDVGALRYFGAYRVLDIEGLADARFRRAGRLGSGGIWETLERMPAAERPSLLAVYASWFDPVFLGPHRPLFAERQFRPSIAAGNPLEVRLADWSLAGNGDGPRDPAVLAELAGWTPIGEVDVADYVSEDGARYAYRILDGAYDNAIRLLPAADGTPVMEGGRIVSGGESFTSDRFAGGGEIALVARTAGPFRLRVRAAGRDQGLWSATGTDGAWQESVYRFGAGGIPAGSLRIDLDGDDPHHSAYGSFHYWIYQRRP